MTAVAPKPINARPYPARRVVKGSGLAHMLRTTDPKDIAILYLVTSFAFFLIGGAMALLIRGELAWPGQQFLSNEQYNQLFTMHGTIMLLLYATPILFGFANYIVPLQIGAPDVAFPRLNAFSYWLFLFGGSIVLSSFLTPGGAADFGWTAYTPLSDAVHSPGPGGDLWIMGLAIAGLGTILGGVNFITTIVCLRAPGMTMFRMPIFTWNIFVTGFLILLAFPVLTAALLSLAIIDAGDPAWQIGSFLLGGAAAFTAHAGKAGARTLVNASPEPFSNIAVSTAEDVATGGLLALAIANPIAAALIALILVILSLWLALTARRALKRLLEPKRRPAG